MVLLLLPLAVPLLLIAGWVAALRCQGVPRWILLGCCATLPIVCGVVGNLAGAAEDRRLPAECRNGTEVGLECGYGIGRLAGYLACFTGVATLVLLAAISLIVWQVRRRSFRGLPALTHHR